MSPFPSMGKSFGKPTTIKCFSEGLIKDRTANPKTAITF
jgi:hypothetical protein